MATLYRCCPLRTHSSPPSRRRSRISPTSGRNWRKSSARRPVGIIWTSGRSSIIESNGNININEPDWEQIIDFVWNLASNILDAVDALASAHALGCGHGYMNGTCQNSVCG